MADIIHRIGIKAPLSKVYQAVTTVEGVAGWWTRETTRAPGPAGELELKVRFHSPRGDEIGFMDFDVLELGPQEVRWRVKAGPADWVGTDLTFNLSREGDYTVLLFGHRNWREATESTAHCSMKWATFLLSLRGLVETGQGRPAPDDLKIDNWN